ncbi:MAG TPA: CBS domain-containing protein [Candidatus Limnocylindrales bacterium]|nr:CBS domain-containing protein [Candidatus Limnocylindrales bacterium]
MAKVRDLMVKKVISLEAHASTHQAVKVMNENKIGCLVILRNGQTVGILTERDLLERVLEKCKNPKDTYVFEAMTSNIITGNPEMEIPEAARVMFENKVKKLPIVDGNKLVGIVTLTDIARAASVDEETIDLVENLFNLHVLDH